MAVSLPFPLKVTTVAHTDFRWDLWQPGLGIVDFTNPEAREWYGEKLKKLMDLGVDCFKVSWVSFIY